MDTIKFYKMLGFDTILDCCYILGNYGEEDRFTKDTYDYIRNRIESSLMVYGYTIEDAVKGWQETIWVGQE